MREELEKAGRDALAALDRAIEAGPAPRHDEIRQAVLPLVAFRDRALALHRAGEAERDTLDGANALVSLVYGAAFPLAGVHVHRLEQTRDGLRALLGDST